eukprot:m.184404 g.184404  ORF g.184404 m.184404 type:complete len:116 (+) comp39318_c4_seq37:7364-7711(+)
MKRDQTKNAKYLEISISLGYLFEPLSMEVFGRWSLKAGDLFQRFALRPSSDFFDDRCDFTGQNGCQCVCRSRMPTLPFAKSRWSSRKHRSPLIRISGASARVGVEMEAVTAAIPK